MVPENETSTSTIARALWFATGGDWNFLTKLEVIGTGDLPSVFAVDPTPHERPASSRRGARGFGSRS